MGLLIVNNPKLIRHDPDAIDALSKLEMLYVCQSLMEKAQLLA